VRAGSRLPLGRALNGGGDGVGGDGVAGGIAPRGGRGAGGELFPAAASSSRRSQRSCSVPTASCKVNTSATAVRTWDSVRKYVFTAKTPLPFALPAK
jgi:hypothetical protein